MLENQVESLNLESIRTLEEIESRKCKSNLNHKFESISESLFWKNEEISFKQNKV